MNRILMAIILFVCSFKLIAQPKFSAGVYAVPAYLEHRHDDFTIDGTQSIGNNSSAVFKEDHWRIRYFTRPFSWSLGGRIRFEPNHNFMIQTGFYYRNFISSKTHFPSHFTIPVIARYSPISSDNLISPYAEIGGEYGIGGNPIPMNFVADASKMQAFFNVGVAVYVTNDLVLDVSPGFRTYITGKDAARFRYNSFQIEIGLSKILYVIEGYYGSDGKRRKGRLDCPTVESIW